MPGATVYLPQAPTYHLEGDHVIVTSKSGDEVFVKVLSIHQFMAAHAASQRIIDEWAQRRRDGNVLLLSDGVVKHA